MSLEEALKFTLRWEGGYSNHPLDKGGPTNFGITQKTYDTFNETHGLPKKDVKGINQEEVKDIYEKLYWNPLECENRERRFAIALFDWGVNSGVRRALCKADDTAEWRTLCEARRNYFYSIAQGANKIFLKGWINRLNSLIDYLEKL